MAFEIGSRVVKMKSARFEFSITYRCNLSCDMCDRFLYLFPWNDSDVSLEDIRLAGERIRDSHIHIQQMIISGGEPTLHPLLIEICKELKRWEDGSHFPFKTHVCTNDTTGYDFGDVLKVVSYVRRSHPRGKLVLKFRYHHRPMLISPADLGLEGEMMGKCPRMDHCGVSFDAFGFTFCHSAGPLGRIFHVDPYSSMPVLKKDVALCRHCIISMPKPLRFSLWRDAERGKLEHPTPTFARALDHCKKFGTMEFQRFQEREA